MKIEKEYKRKTLMGWTKKELADRIMVLEHNNNVLHETIDQQAKNFMEMMKEKSSRWVHVYKSGLEVSDGYVSECCDMWSRQKTKYCPYCGKRMIGD